LRTPIEGTAHERVESKEDNQKEKKDKQTNQQNKLHQ
jgi:hypothetical protein